MRRQNDLRSFTCRSADGHARRLIKAAEMVKFSLRPVRDVKGRIKYAIANSHLTGRGPEATVSGIRIPGVRSSYNISRTSTASNWTLTKPPLRYSFDSRDVQIAGEVHVT